MGATHGKNVQIVKPAGKIGEKPAFGALPVTVPYKEKRRPFSLDDLSPDENISEQLKGFKLDFLLEKCPDYEFYKVVGYGGEGIALLYKDKKDNRFHLGKVYDVPRTVKDVISEVRREEKNLKGLSHQGLPKYYDSIDFSEERAFMTRREYKPGDSLEQKLKEGYKFSAKEVFDIMTQLLDILHYLHERNIIHRDIKPANVIIDEIREVSLIDFGFAKRLTDESVSMSQSTKGSFPYMPRESYIPDGNFVPCTDFYSLGMSLAELLEGKFSNKRLKTHINSSEPYRLSEKLMISDEFRYVIEKMTYHDQDRRYQSIDEIISDLKGFGLMDDENNLEMKPEEEKKRYEFMDEIRKKYEEHVPKMIRPEDIKFEGIFDWLMYKTHFWQTKKNKKETLEGAKIEREERAERTNKRPILNYIFKSILSSYNVAEEQIYVPLSSSRTKLVVFDNQTMRYYEATMEIKGENSSHWDLAITKGDRVVDIGTYKEVDSNIKEKYANPLHGWMSRANISLKLLKKHPRFTKSYLDWEGEVDLKKGIQAAHFILSLLKHNVDLIALSREGGMSGDSSFMFFSYSLYKKK